MTGTLFDDRARALMEAGDVEALDAWLAGRIEAARAADFAARALAEVAALDRVGSRDAAVELARRLTARHPELTDVRALADAVAGRRRRGPRFSLDVEGRRLDVVTSERAVVLGRADAEIVVPSPLVSRKHLRLEREGDVIRVVDLGSQNGTTLAGARVAAPLTLPEGARLDLRLGGEVPVTFEHRGAEVLVRSPGRECSWGRRVGPFAIDGAGRLVGVAGGPVPVLGEDVAVPEGIDLAEGDVVRAERRGVVVVAVH